jgi:hypothetical protein
MESIINNDCKALIIELMSGEYMNNLSNFVPASENPK